MGDFRVRFEIGPIGGQAFERIQALVDTGAIYTWVPRDVLDGMGVRPEDEQAFVLADGREVNYPIASVRVRMFGRTRFTQVIFGEPGSEPLLGVYTLEAFSLAVDPVNRRLFPVPGNLKLAV